ncbi:MAG: hypothetical protein ABII16_02360 [Patescibacteria group bacterium]
MEKTIHFFVNHKTIFENNSEAIISDFLRNADVFFNASMYLLKGCFNTTTDPNSTEYLIPAGFLAARSAEYYLKGLILSFEPNVAFYEKCHDSSHDLGKLLGILEILDNEAKSLELAISNLDKYSGEKVSYPEPAYYKNFPDSFGSDEISCVKIIKSFVYKKLDW